MTRDEALNEIKSCLLAGNLELTGEWGKVISWNNEWIINKGSRDSFTKNSSLIIPYITDALEHKIIEKLGRYLILYLNSLVQICRWDYLANRLPDRIIGEGKDKLSALWEAWKRLDKEQKQ